MIACGEFFHIGLWARQLYFIVIQWHHLLGQILYITLTQYCIFWSPSPYVHQGSVQQSHLPTHTHTNTHMLSGWKRTGLSLKWKSGKQHPMFLQCKISWRSWSLEDNDSSLWWHILACCICVIHFCDSADKMSQSNRLVIFLCKLEKLLHLAKGESFSNPNVSTKHKEIVLEKPHRKGGKLSNKSNV